MKKKPNLFLRTIFILFIIFLGLYIASVSGYYQDKVGDKVALTDEAIKQFEQDVLDGKIVDLNTYVVENRVDYSNKFTETGEKCSEVIEKLITEGFGGAFDVIKMLFF